MLSKLSRPLLLSAASALIIASALGGCSTLSGKSKKAERAAAAAKAPNMGVNSYLWRASLETLNFMPLEQVDPFGGVIVTDWYTSAEAPTERFKANVYILDTALRADALKASIFKQTRNAGGWEDASVDADTARQIENAILTRARELYIATVDSR
ncbi:uncharacterized protein DUF3576 [Litorimonas taeanensis]|uniref:Uncharacterized protein DUF3576 n=1 Tax=Litorimonas taeanensis TaxID=568099 RepID=A0A420WEN9_9PROT|nr:DUF3576 domain-containing protein [Litorimonas taeanensis]RKQ69449.1 uncharacterized protein DUF3576 [Litorimonas taeanensis]